VARAKKESSLAIACKKIAREFGGRFIRQYPYEAGWPDYLLMLSVFRDPVYAHVELKTRTGKVSEIQCDVLNKLNYQGCKTAVVRDIEGMRNLCRALTTTTD